MEVKMNILNWKEKTWRRLYEAQLIYAVLLFILSLVSKPTAAVVFELVIVAGILY